jgi:CRP-like cAMP-binding protein
MEQVDWKTFIKAHPVFSSLTRKEVERVLTISEPRSFSAGTEIVREGERGDSVLLIGAGAVDVTLHWSDEQTIQLATLHEGEFFGEMAIFENTTRRSASVTAAGDCSLLEIKGQDFLKLAAYHPEIESTVIGKLTARLRDVNEHVIKVKLKSLDEKIDVLNMRMDSQRQAAEATNSRLPKPSSSRPITAPMKLSRALTEAVTG